MGRRKQVPTPATDIRTEAVKAMFYGCVNAKTEDNRRYMAGVVLLRLAEGAGPTRVAELMGLEVDRVQKALEVLKRHKLPVAYVRTTGASFVKRYRDHSPQWAGDVGVLVRLSRSRGCMGGICPVTGVSLRLAPDGFVVDIQASGYAQDGMDLLRWRLLFGDLR